MICDTRDLLSTDQNIPWKSVKALTTPTNRSKKVCPTDLSHLKEPFQNMVLEGGPEARKTDQTHRLRAVRGPKKAFQKFLGSGVNQAVYFQQQGSHSNEILL